MTKSKEDMNNFLEELENLFNELKYYENLFKNFNSSFDNKINTLNNDFNIFKEEIDNIKQYLLLGLETNLNNDSSELGAKYNELFKLIKKDNYKKISYLSEELGKCKQVLDDKNKLILEFENNELKFQETIQQDKNEISELISKNDELNECISKTEKIIDDLNLNNSDKDFQITELNDKLVKEQEINDSVLVRVNELEVILVQKDSEIQKLNKYISKKDNDIKGLKLINLDKNEQNNQLNNELIEVKNQVEMLLDENKMIKLTLDEKENNIKLLNDEIKILETIIGEKDQTINSLSREE